MERKKRPTYVVERKEIAKNVGDIKANKTKYDFATRLNELLIEKEISQEQMSAETGINFASLSKYRNGISEPKATTLKMIADYLEVSADYLLGSRDIISAEEEFINVYKYTALSDKSTSELIKNRLIDDTQYQFDILNMLLEKDIMFPLLEAVTNAVIYPETFRQGYKDIKEEKFYTDFIDYQFTIEMTKFIKQIRDLMTRDKDYKDKTEQAIKEKLNNSNVITSIKEAKEDFAKNIAPSIKDGKEDDE